MRTSIVGAMRVTSVAYSSTVQIGDLFKMDMRSKALAVQRSVPTFIGNEGNFEFPLFHRPIPEPAAAEKVIMNVRQTNPFIVVGEVDVSAVSASSVIQVGSNSVIEAEARIKHIRQLIKD